jgi:glycerol-3-phosphate O-acyltransferase/dihydroxyacetone phosphate acyltransferase
VLAYRMLAFLLRLAVRAFFRRVEVVGLEHVPAEGQGPVIFCGNHPNSLLDPVLITVTCGRIVHFAAKDVLFQTAILRAMLTGMGAVPIKRRKDHGGDSINNDDAFAALYDVLTAGRAMGIFPEGISHGDAHISKLKTGAARIALGAAKQQPGMTLTVVPCGLHYATRERFRSSVLVQFGEPIVIDAALLAVYDEDPRAAARSVTDDIDQGIRSLTVNADDWETARVLDGVRRLYQPPRIALQERVELARRFNEAYPKYRSVPQVSELYESVEGYLDRLAGLGLTDRDVLQKRSGGRLALSILTHLMLLLVWLPLAVVGAPVHLPVGILLYWSAPRFTPRKDVLATTKFLLGFLLLLLLYLGLSIGVGAAFGWAFGLLMMLLLPVSGYAAILCLRHFGAIDRWLTVILGRFTLGRQLKALRQRRATLEQRVVRTVNELHPKDMELLFPREVPQ